MFVTVLTADLPSEEFEGAAPDDDGLSQRHERVSYSSSRLLRTLQRVFDQAEIRDVVSVVIDGRNVYVDEHEARNDDLEIVVVEAQREGFLDQTFQELEITLAHWEDGLQHVARARVRTAVPVGEHELSIELSSRPDDFNARRLDDAERYRERLRDLVADPMRLDELRARVERVATRIDAALRRTLFRRTVTLGHPVMRIVRPSIEALMGMESAVFGPTIVPPRYRVVGPTDPTAAEWPDPAWRVYDDPFLCFRHWALLDALMTHRLLRLEWVHVVEPGGRLLFEGHKARWFEGWPWGRKFAVRCVPEGGVRVSLTAE